MGWPVYRRPFNLPLPTPPLPSRRRVVSADFLVFSLMKQQFCFSSLPPPSLMRIISLPIGSSRCCRSQISLVGAVARSGMIPWWNRPILRLGSRLSRVPIMVSSKVNPDLTFLLRSVRRCFSTAQSALNPLRQWLSDPIKTWSLYRLRSFMLLSFGFECARWLSLASLPTHPSFGVVSSFCESHCIVVSWAQPMSPLCLPPIWYSSVHRLLLIA